MNTRVKRWAITDAAALTAAVACAVAAAWTVWVDIFTIGLTDPENSHILLAIPVAGMLAYLRKGRLRSVAPSPSWLGPLIVAAAAGLYILGSRFGFEVLEHTAALLLIIGGIVSAVGWRVLIAFAPSLLALLFLLPVPGRVRREIAIPLQEWSAKIVEWSLELFAVPVARTGNALSVNSVEVAIAEACNGMRMVSALGIVTLAFVFAVPMRPGVRVLFLVLSPIVALLVNVVRLIPTVLFYGYGTTDAAEAFHDLSGWAVLGVAILMLYGLVALLRWLEIPVSPYPVRTA